MKNEFYYLSADQKTRIHAIEWIPQGDIRAVLQICHGMCEFIGRYEEFAHFLCEQGYLVTGNDHLGHGASITDEEDRGYFAEPDGNACVLADIHTLRTLTQEKYPHVPYFLLGHSMGSFLARQYICRHGAGLSGAIIMGTGSQPGMILNLGIFLCRLSALFHGSRYRSHFINNLAFGGYNKKFEPARTPSDWLTKDAAIIDSYISHPSCTFIFTVNAYQSMFRSIRSAQDGSQIAHIPKALPILVVSGTDDPVGNFGRGVRQVYDAYRSAGIQDVSISLYDGDRHEILNETDREQVYQDLLAWMEGRQKI